MRKPRNQERPSRCRPLRGKSPLHLPRRLDEAHSDVRWPDLDPTVDHGYAPWTQEWVLLRSELESSRIFIDRFQEARTESLMDLDGGAGQIFVLQALALFRRFLVSSCSIGRNPQYSPRRAYPSTRLRLARALIPPKPLGGGGVSRVQLALFGRASSPSDTVASPGPCARVVRRRRARRGCSRAPLPLSRAAR